MPKRIMAVIVVVFAVVCSEKPLSADEIKTGESFSRAIERIGSSERTLVLSDIQKISARLTVPRNVVLRFIDQGALSIDTKITVTINGPIDAPAKQIFSGAGKVTFERNRPEKIYPQWWGARGDGETDDTLAIQRAIDSTPDGGQCLVFFPPGAYRVTSPINMRPSLSLVGVPRLSAVVSSTCSILQSEEQEKPLSMCKIEGITFRGPGKGSRKIGINLTNVSYCVIRDVGISRFGRGILMAGFSGYGEFYNLAVSHCKIGIEANDSTIANKIFGGRMGGNTIGILINAANDFSVYGISIEGFETAIKINRCDTVHLYHPYLEAGTTAIDIGPGAVESTILNPRISSVKNRIIDKSSDTLILDQTHKSNLLKTKVLYTDGISGTDKKSNNLRGQVTISGRKMRASVKFQTPEPDADYFAVATAASTRGAPPSGATNAHIEKKSANGFNVVLGQAPGRGNHVKVDWILVR